MTKFRKFIPVLVCSFLIAGGSVAAFQGINRSVAKEAQAVTDCGPVSLRHDPSTNGGGNASSIYMAADANDITFNDWAYKIHPVGGVGGLFIDNVDMGNVELVKFSATQYWVSIGTTLTAADAGKVVTITGEWTYSDGTNDHIFAVSPEFKICWGGQSWVDYYDLEDYDVVSLMDVGMPNYMGTSINTEIPYGYENLYGNSFPIQNDSGSYAFKFGWEALNDASGVLWLRIGSNGANTDGHYLELIANNEWGTEGVAILKECLNGTELHTTGDINLNLKSGAEHTLEIGMVKIKNSTDYNVFLHHDGLVIKSLRWALDAAPMTTRVGMYYGGNSLNITNKTTQVFGTERLHAGDMNGSVGVYLNTDVDLYPDIHNWDEQGLPYENSNIMFKGNPCGHAADNYFKKTDAKQYYLGFSAIGINPSAGDIMTIGGSFKFVHTVSGTLNEEGAVYETVRIAFAQSAFRFDGTKWVDYDIALLENSSADQLEAGNLLANIGRTRPDGTRTSSVKCFDQGVVWDADLGAEVDTLVYKKDTNGHTGVYFTSGDETTHGEFRVYLPDNGYKTESKGYAMSHFSFDYILDSTGTPTETNRNHSLTSDGYYIAPLPAATSNFTLQVLCHNSSSMYFDFEESLINDGKLHTFSFDLDYSDVMGFCFVLWNFKGTFFMSNCHATYLEYNQALNELVYQHLEMYSYVAESNKCLSEYAGAKTAYLALTDGEKAIFNTNAAYGSARARLAAWALANGEVYDAVNGTITANARGLSIKVLENNNITVISVVTFAIALVSTAGVMLVIKKRKYNK